MVASAITGSDQPHAPELHVALTGLLVVLILACSACVFNPGVSRQLDLPGPQITEIDRNGNTQIVGTASIANFSGHFKMQAPQQLDPPAPVDPADGSVILDPRFSYWLASDDQFFVSWENYSLLLPCVGSSDFSYNLCADQTLLSRLWNSPSQCAADTLTATADYQFKSRAW